MAASEIRRAIIGTIPDCLRNCVNKEYFMRSSSGAGYSEGEMKSFEVVYKKKLTHLLIFEYEVTIHYFSAFVPTYFPTFNSLLN